MHARQGLTKTVCARLHLQLLVICARAHIVLLAENEPGADTRVRERGLFLEPGRQRVRGEERRGGERERERMRRVFYVNGGKV